MRTLHAVYSQEAWDRNLGVILGYVLLTEDELEQLRDWGMIQLYYELRPAFVSCDPLPTDTDTIRLYTVVLYRSKFRPNGSWHILSDASAMQLTCVRMTHDAKERLARAFAEF